MEKKSKSKPAGEAEDIPLITTFVIESFIQGPEQSLSVLLKTTVYTCNFSVTAEFTFIFL